MLASRLSRLALTLLALTMIFGVVSLSPAEARMGGSFGSRGTRTFQSAPPTNISPSAAPIQRSMTPNKPAPTSSAQPPPVQSRPSFWSGFGGGIVGGLVFSGLFGMISGQGFGGLGGGFSFIFQLLIIGGIVMLAMPFFRRGGAAPAETGRSAFSFGQQNYGTGTPPSTPSGYGATSANGGTGRDEIGITSGDLAAFERLLTDVQDAFSREDHQGLRRLTTPEMVSYLSEELADNATRGLKNEVSSLRLLNGEVAEAWREGNRDYATMAMHWSAIDVMRNRQSGALEKGDPDKPVETTELWTFTREGGGSWLLSAIQDAPH